MRWPGHAGAFGPMTPEPSTSQQATLTRRRHYLRCARMSAAELSTAPSLPYPGSRFVRADLHVHTHKDSEVDPAPDLARYVAAALQADIEILAVTDHNHVRFVRAAIAAAQGTTLTVLPGIEISTHDGH